MAIRTRSDVLPFHTGIDASMLTRASKLVAAATSFPVQYNKAIVGRNAFAHESGIHQDGMLKHTQTYEIMRPEDVGVKQTSLVMGKHSGRHAFVHKLEELGYQLASNQLEDAFVRFKALADKKKQIYDEDIEALVDEEIATAHDRIKIISLTVIAGTMGPQSATLTLDIEGKHVTVQSPWGPIRVKLGLLEGEVVNFAPEFEDCRQLAEASGVPLKTVLQKATHLYLATVTGSAALPDPASKSSS